MWMISKIPINVTCYNAFEVFVLFSEANYNFNFWSAPSALGAISALFSGKVTCQQKDNSH